MRNLITVRRLLPLAAVIAVFALAQGCGDEGGGGGGRFVPNDNKIEKINGMSPSEAFHQKDRKR
jgi:hypothetical protein